MYVMYYELGVNIMKKFIITVDSSCEVSKEILDNLGIKMIYINYSDGQKVYSSNMNHEDYQKFYENMEKGVVYKTSQINVQEYYDFFEPLVKENDNILHISLASGLSNTINNVYIANEMLKEKYENANIIPLDSKIASLGVYLIALQAYKLQQEDKDINEAFDLMSNFVKTVNTYFTTDDLTYFARGGRLNKVSAFIGNALKINPVLDCLPNGQLRVVKRLRGRRKAIEYIIERMNNTLIEPENQTLFICHANCETRANELATILMDRFHFKKIETYPMGPIIGAHAGPGLIALFYTGKTRSVEITNNLINNEKYYQQFSK